MPRDLSSHKYSYLTKNPRVGSGSRHPVIRLCCKNIEYSGKSSIFCHSPWHHCSLPRTHTYVYGLCRGLCRAFRFRPFFHSDSWVSKGAHPQAAAQGISNAPLGLEWEIFSSGGKFLLPQVQVIFGAENNYHRCKFLLPRG